MSGVRLRQRRATEPASAAGGRAGVAPAGAPVVAYLVGFITYGLAVNVSGPALSHLRDHVGTDDGGIGLVFVGQSSGYIIGSLVVAKALDRGQGHRWWAASIAAASVGMAFVAVATSLWTLVAAFAVMGISFGVTDVCANALVVWSRPGRSDPVLNGLHLCFAIGALLSPFAVNRALAWTDSIWPVVVPMVVVGGAVTFQLLRRPAPVKTRVESPRHGVAGTEPAGSAAAARGWHIAAICSFFLVYVAVEAGFAGWIHSYVEQIHYGGTGTATGVTAIFWTGFTLGRVAAIWLARTISAGWMIAGSMSLMTVSAVAFFVFRGPGVALWVVTFLFAVSVAPQFASMISFAESHLALSGRSTSAFLAAAGIGGLLMPWLLGVLFDHFGAEALPPVVVGASLLAVAAGALVGRMLASRQRPPATSMHAPVT